MMDDYTIEFECPQHGRLGFAYRQAVEASAPLPAYTREEWLAIVVRNRQTLYGGHGIEIITDDTGEPRKVAGRCEACRNLGVANDPQVSLARINGLLDEAEATGARGRQLLTLT